MATSSATATAPSTSKYGSGKRRPIIVGDDEMEENEKARELDVQTFYLEEDIYDDLHQRWYRSCERDRQCMQNEGLVWRKGWWSVQELRILKRNVKAFMREHGVKDIASYITSGKSTKKGKQFYQFIGKGIKRTLFSIYQKCSLVFNLQNYVGKWTHEMDQEMLRLHKIYGNKWVEIGKHVGTTGRAALDRFRHINNRKKVGFWSESEERKLCQAMAEIQKEHGGDSDDLPSTVRWKDVAAKIETRTAMQCLNKWIVSLSWKRNPRTNVKWTVSDDLKLIHTLASLEDVEDEEEVDWQGLCRDWPAAHNVHCLKRQWASIRRDVPHYHVQTMQENLEYLVTNKVPELEQLCKK